MPGYGITNKENTHAFWNNLTTRSGSPPREVKEITSGVNFDLELRTTRTAIQNLDTKFEGLKEWISSQIERLNDTKVLKESLRGGSQGTKVRFSSNLNKLIRDFIWSNILPKAPYEHQSNYIARITKILKDFVESNEDTLLPTQRSLVEEIKAYGLSENPKEITEPIEYALLRLRTNERSSWFYEVKKALTMGQFSKLIPKCPDNSIQEAGAWVGKVAEIADQLLQPRTSGYIAEWKQTLEVALDKGSKDKESLDLVGIEALAMFAVQQYLRGKKKLPADESVNKKSWKKYVEYVCEDRAKFEQNAENENVNREEDFDTSSIGDPDEILKEKISKLRNAEVARDAAECVDS